MRQSRGGGLGFAVMGGGFVAVGNAGSPLRCGMEERGILEDGGGGGGGELADHGQQEAAVAFGEVGGVALDLGEEADLFGGEGDARGRP